MAAVGVDGAADGHVTDGGVLDVAERCHTSLTRVGVFDIGRQRVALAEEGAAEGLALVHTHHIGNHDVGRQLHVLAAVVLTVINGGSELEPVGRSADEIGSLCCAGAGEWGND